MSASIQLDRPCLLTFHRRPSWCNRAGRVDRSACLELDVRNLWRRVFPSDWRITRQPRASGCIARASITIDADYLDELFGRRKPRELVGDFRTPKSNAMKEHRDPPRRRHRRPHDIRWSAMRDPARIEFANPNRGAGASKRHGFALDRWQQTIQIERRITGRKGIKAPRHQGIQGSGSKPSHRLTASPSHPLMPRCLDALMPPNHQHYLICPKCSRHVRKLFAILAAQEELHDAQNAELWLTLSDQLPQRLLSQPQRTELRAARRELINRYGPLFNSSTTNQSRHRGIKASRHQGRDAHQAPHPLMPRCLDALMPSLNSRRFLCRTCLHIRYGEVKKSRRPLGPNQSAREWMAPFIARPPMHRDKALYLSNAPKPRNSPRRTQRTQREISNGTADERRWTQMDERLESELISVHPRSSAAKTSAASRAQARRAARAAELAAAHQSMFRKFEAEAQQLMNELRADGIDVDRLFPPLPTMDEMLARIQANPKPLIAALCGTTDEHG